MKRFSLLLVAALLLAGCGHAASLNTSSIGTTNSRDWNSGGLAYHGEDFTKLGISPIRYSHRAHSTVPAALRDQNEQLIQAAWDNDLDRVKELTAQGADINYYDAAQETPYLITTSEGYPEMLKYFITHYQPDISIHDRYNGNGTIRAAERGHAEVVALLRHVKDDVNRINYPGYTALVESIIFGTGDQRYAETVLVLAALKADFNLHRSTSSPLDEAKQMQQEAIIGIIERVLSVKELADPQGYLRHSVEQGDATGVAIALRFGAIVEPDLAASSHNEVVTHLLRWFTE